MGRDPAPFWHALETALLAADRHPEIDAGLHSLMALEQAARICDQPQVRFAALMHDLGKTRTPRAEWPSHKGHEERGVPIVEELCRRLRAPALFREIGMLGARWHGIAHRAADLRAATLLEIVSDWDGIAGPDHLEWLIVIGIADKRGRTGQEAVAYPPGSILRAARAAAASVSHEDRDRERQLRIAAIEKARVLSAA